MAEAVQNGVHDGVQVVASTGVHDATHVASQEAWQVASGSVVQAAVQNGVHPASQAVVLMGVQEGVQDSVQVAVKVGVGKTSPSPGMTDALRSEHTPIEQTGMVPVRVGPTYDVSLLTQSCVDPRRNGLVVSGQHGDPETTVLRKGKTPQVSPTAPVWCSKTPPRMSQASSFSTSAHFGAMTSSWGVLRTS